MKYLLSKYLKINIWIVFGVIVTIYFVALTIEFKFVFTDDFYHQSFDAKNSYEQVQSFIIADRNKEWLNYPFAIFRILIPSTLITSLFYLGKIIREFKVSFFELFEVALKAQMIFAINYILAVILRLRDLIDGDWASINNNYYYQSLLIFFRESNLPYWLYYPLQCINISEFLHILILTFGIHSITSLKFKSSLSFVLVFYGAGLLIWIIFTVFLQTIIYQSN